MPSIGRKKVTRRKRQEFSLTHHINDAMIDSSPPIHVAVAVILDQRGHILIALRPEHLHQGGLWEFPGGKLEAGEDVRKALARELEEELDIRVTRAHPLIRIPYHYPEQHVLLDVWQVDGFSGIAHGREGQNIAWVPAETLNQYHFPSANLPIVTAARLPPLYLITPEPGEPVHWPEFLGRLDNCLAGGVRMIQLRAKQLADKEYRQLASQVVERCKQYGASLLLNAPPEWVSQVGAHGVHLSGERLGTFSQRPLSEDLWVAASCHNLAELEQAARLKVDFSVVSPVAATSSHPGAAILGWEGLRQLTEFSPFPVYALGGMSPLDMRFAWEHGAQGIALISALWQAATPAEILAEAMSNQ